MYNLLCFLMIAAGGALLYIFPYQQNPGKAVCAGILIGLGLFLLLFKGKGADNVRRFSESANSGWWHWW
jgi:hypothetical protein